MRKNYLNFWRRLAAVMFVAMLVPMTASAQKFVTTRLDDASRIRYNFYEDESTGELYALIGKEDYDANGIVPEIKILKKVLITPGAPMEEYAEVRGIEDGAFEGTHSLERVIFEGHDYEASLNLPYYRYEIGARAFKNCEKLQYVDIREAKSIGDEAFMGCTQLDRFDVTGVIDYIGEHCFAGCTKLPEFMYYNDNDMKIGKGCFENCTGLKTVQLPNKLEEIPDEAFKGCKLLGSEKDFVLPTSLKRIGSNAFEGCGLKKVLFWGSITISEDGKTEVYDEPIYVDEIGKEAFVECKNLQRVDFGGTRKVGAKAFYDLPKLEEVSFNLNAMHVIGSEAFAGCNKLKGDYPYDPPYYGLELSTALTSLGFRAFYQCTSLESVYIPDGCELAPNEDGIKDGYFYGCSQLKRVRLPKDLKVLPSWMFYESDVEEIEWPTELTTIEGHAFMDCNNLQKVDLSGAKVETIGNSAFRTCKKLEELDLGTTLKELGTDCFAECSSLKSVTVPESCEKIGNNAFAAHYSGITSESKRHMQLENLYLLGKNLKTIPKNLCSADENLKYVELPPNLETIDEKAFAGCKNLKYVSFPASLRSIGYDAFANNRAETYRALSTDPQPFSEDLNPSSGWFKCPFYNVNSKTEQYYFFTDAVLYVPTGMTETYRQVEGWRLFKEIKETDGNVTRPEGIRPQRPDEADDLIYEYFYEDGGIHVCIDADSGEGYDKDEKCLKLLNIPGIEWYLYVTDPEGYYAHWSDWDDFYLIWLKSHFTGIHLQVVGKGNIEIDFKTLGVKWMYVKIGDKKVQAKHSTDKKSTIKVKFDCDDPTDVWIWPMAAGYEDEEAPSMSLRRAEEGENSEEDALMIYSLKVVESEETGIETVTNVFDATAPVYDLNGRRVKSENLKPGVYVRQGKKMVVK